MLIIALALALLIGLSLGLLGGGGSILTVPILKYVLGLEAHRAVALSLLVVGTTSIAALIPHARRGRVHFRTGLLFGAAGMIGAYLAGSVAHFIPAALLLTAFSLMMLITAIAMLRGGAATSREPQNATHQHHLPFLKVLGEGLVVGGVTGLVGAGGGFLVVPALVLLGGLPMQVAVGTSLVVIAMKSFAGFAGYLRTTPVDWTLGVALSVAAVLGSMVGGLLAGKIASSTLRQAFGWFVVAMAFFIFAQEVPPLLQAHSSIGVSVVVAIAGLGLTWGAQRLSRRWSIVARRTLASASRTRTA